ncbi:MAG: hypothetical protein IJ745_01235 [Bacteroidales bacterium]|nr:hypothetical protein [Bacteroidales bacterium]
MKRLALIAIGFATLGFASCSVLGNAAGNTVAQTLGQSCGSAVLGLYQAYKSTGTIDLTNTTNLTNALAVAAAYTQLQQNKEDQTFRKAFTSGLVLSSAGLITNQNAGAFINTMLANPGLASVDNNGTTSSNSSTSGSTSSGGRSEAVPAFGNLMKALE